MKNLVVVTGGSGFIGLNLTQAFIDEGYEVINLDIKPPKNTNLLGNYYYLDVTDRRALCVFLESHKPKYLIHLAARTDIRGESLDDYDVNIKGVENVCVAVSQSTSLERVLFASSMLVCKAGHIPESCTEYSATTAYGKSKVEGEKVVNRYHEKLPSYRIFRPTSIWGPWFDAPYKTFFDVVLKRRYFNIGEKSSTKTYGYIENAVNQIMFLLKFDGNVDCNTPLYIGDSTPVNVDSWAKLICRMACLPKPYSIPFPLLICAGVLGDILAFIGVGFPLTSFRIKNMTTDNVLSKYTVSKLYSIDEVCLEEGVKHTLEWMKSEEG